LLRNQLHRHLTRAKPRHFGSARKTLEALLDFLLDNIERNDHVEATLERIHDGLCLRGGPADFLSGLHVPDPDSDGWLKNDDLDAVVQVKIDAIQWQNFK
jgi:hypothetical protein